MGWRDRILSKFAPQVARVTLVADPDGLLLEEGVLQAVRERGFDVVQYQDPTAFRYLYESTYRIAWDRGESTPDLVVVVRGSALEAARLPADLLEIGRRLEFSLASLFPNLNHLVVGALDRSDFDKLYNAQATHRPGPLGENDTKKFVLHHVFALVPDLVASPTELLRVLLKRHHQGQRIPKVLDDYFVEVLRQNPVFDGWPLERIVPDRDAFLAFLQERWPIYLDRLARGGGRALAESKPDDAYGLEFPGPVDLPFGHDDVRVYVDTLFLEGALRPVPHSDRALRQQWVAVGVQASTREDRAARLGKVLDSIEQALPGGEAKYQDWLAFAYPWAELVVLRHQDAALLATKPDLDRQYLEARDRLDAAFLSWVEKRYGGLHNQPAVSAPVMLHHVPRFLARRLESKAASKVALLLVDGLALDQWLVLRDVLTRQLPRLRLHEGAAFAWLPTITSISRQAAFSGKAPVLFAETIYRTDRDSAHWTRFWTGNGLLASEVSFEQGLGENQDLVRVDAAISHSAVRVAGLVVDKVDKIMHGMQLGTAGMHSQVRQWAEEGFLGKLLDLLLGSGFEVLLTSDHGNVEAVGRGTVAEGSIADTRGERARLYPNQVLRAQVKAKLTNAIEWSAIGLPPNVLPLLAGGRTAFIKAGEHTVAHGSLALEELVVPMIRVERRTE